MALVKRFFPELNESFFLFGPRGTGKSTLIKMNYENALWINLLLPEVLRRFLGYPERLVDLIAANPSKSVIVIDEVQKAPQLLSVVHSLIEQKSGLQFILTGSSARKLKQQSANLLGGRALNRTLYPFMAAEVGEQFSLPSALENGLLPLIFNEKQPQNKLQAYISLYLHEEIQAKGMVRNVENFSRFLEVVTFSHTSLLNTANIARECEVKRKTVENYIEILEDLLLAFRLPVFSKRAQRALSTHPKFYLFDAGVFYALRPKGPLDMPEEMQGAALEGLVATHLKTWIDYGTDTYTLSFWRTPSGVEVDFIVYGEKGFWAIEVKNSRNVGFTDTKGLEAFVTDYPMARAILLYRGDEIIRQKNVLCIPVDEFLVRLQPNHPLWSD